MFTSSTTIKTTTFIISLREYSKEELLSVVAFLQNHVGHYILSCYQIYPLSEVGCSISNMDRINEYLIFDKNLWLYSIVWQMYNYSSSHISLFLTSIFHPIRITTQNDISNDGISVTMDHLHEFQYTEIQNIAFIYLFFKKPNQ